MSMKFYALLVGCFLSGAVTGFWPSFDRARFANTIATEPSVAASDKNSPTAQAFTSSEVLPEAVGPISGDSYYRLQWEDPGAKFRKRWIGMTFPTAASIDAEVASVILEAPNKVGLLHVFAATNPTRDWLTTADYMMGIRGLTPAEHSSVLTQICGLWVIEEQPDVALAWRSRTRPRWAPRRGESHRGHESFPETAKKLAASITDPEIRISVEREAMNRLKPQR